MLGPVRRSNITNTAGTEDVEYIDKLLERTEELEKQFTRETGDGDVHIIADV